MVRSVVQSVLACAVLLSCWSLQAQTDAVHLQSAQRGDVYAGFSYVSNDATFSGSLGAVVEGRAGADFNVLRWLAVSPEIMVGTGKVTNASATNYSFLIGPRVFLPVRGSAGVRPFGDVLVGITQVNVGKSADSLKSSTSGTASLDVGADVRIYKRVSWRGQLGYLYSSHLTHINDEVQNVPNSPVWHLEISTGPSFHF